MVKASRAGKAITAPPTPRRNARRSRFLLKIRLMVSLLRASGKAGDEGVRSHEIEDHRLHRGALPRSPGDLGDEGLVRGRALGRLSRIEVGEQVAGVTFV